MDIVTALTARLRRLLATTAAAWIGGSHEHYVRELGALCPRCGAARGTLSLLTAYAAYYACDHCSRRWSIVASPEPAGASYIESNF
jgi:hypothetical protein